MATSAFTDASQLLGTLKQRYASDIKDLRLKVAVCQTEVPFKTSALLGDKYHQPVVLTQSAGTFFDTAGGSRSMPDDPVAMQTQDLAIPAYEVTERLRIPFGTIAALDAGSAASFLSTQTLKLLALQKAEIRAVEWSLLYGQEPVAAFTAIGTDWSSNVIILKADHASIADAMLAGMENAPVDLYDGSNTLLNANGALTITAVNLDNTVSGSVVPLISLKTTNGTDQSSIDTAIASGTIYMYRRSSFGFEMPGLIHQAKNTGSLFGVTYSNYSLLQAVQNTTIGQPTMTKALAMVARAQSRGLEEDLQLWVGPKVWNNMMVDIAALRRIGGGDYDPGLLENGAKAVKFYSQSGSLMLVNHPFMKNGDWFGCAPSNLARIGATDIVDNLGGENLNVMQSSNNAFEFRLFTNQAIANIAPAQSLYGSGITLATV